MKITEKIKKFFKKKETHPIAICGLVPHPMADVRKCICGIDIYLPRFMVPRLPQGVVLSCPYCAVTKYKHCVPKNELKFIKQYIESGAIFR